jgi:hypothetical protein
MWIERQIRPRLLEAAELGAEWVEAQALICRTPNRYPLGHGVEALPLEEAGSWLGIRPATPRD